jgi:hypothetical protein
MQKIKKDFEMRKDILYETLTIFLKIACNQSKDLIHVIDFIT